MSGIRHLLRSGRHAAAPLLGPAAVRQVAPRRALAAAHLRIVLGAIQDPYGEDVKTTHLLDHTISFTSWEALHQRFDAVYLEGSAAFVSDNPRSRIIDIGADIGVSTLWMAAAYPDAHITTIERDPATFTLLLRNLDQNGLGHVDAHLATTAVTSHCEDVPTIRLSDLVDGPVDLLRFDQHGAELDAIADLVETGAIEAVRCIAMDFHHVDPDADERLQKLYALLDGAAYRHIVVSGDRRRHNAEVVPAPADIRDAA